MKRLGLLLLLAPGLFTPNAAAAVPEPPAAAPTKAQADEAKRRFEAGIKLYNEGALEPALAEFEASYRLAGRASALRNVAQCQRDLKRFAEAHEAYEALLRRHDKELKPEDGPVVRHALEELALLTGLLELSVTEPDATIELDGKTLVAPPPVVRVSVGSHRLRVTKPGFDPYEKEIAVSSGQTLPIEVKLARELATGRVVVRERDGDAVRVLVDGADVGPAPWEGELAPGEHRIALGGERFAAEPQTVQLGRGSRVDLVLDAVSTRARLRITTIPSSATITIDGERLGSGAWEGELPPGDHQIEVSHEGATTVRRTLTLVRGQSLVQEIPLPDIATVDEPPDYVGFYGRVNGYLMLGNTHEPYVASGFGEPDEEIPFGFGGTVRVGYSFGLLAAEIAGGFSVGNYDHQELVSTDPAGQAAGAREIFNVFSPAGFIGLGGRITSPHETARFTFGADFGVVIRSFRFDLELSCSSGGGGQCPFQSGSSMEFETGYVAPALQLDGGMLLGSTPGAKFFLGALTWIEIPTDPDLAVGPDSLSPRPDASFAAPGRGFYVSRIVPVYVGPVLGVQFGH